MQASLSDQKFLLKSLSQRDYTAFWQLWMPYQDYLYHCCLTWMDGNVTDAQDALSQATLKAWDKLPHHADKITNLKAWLTRFTHNVCMDIHREHGTKAIGIDNFEEIAGQVEVVTFPVESSESAILDSEIEITIRCAIKALPPRMRSPFIMRFEQDMSYLDIAQKLGISIDNVYKRISQARSILKQQMNKYILQEDDSAFLEIPLPSIKKQKPTKANLNKKIQQKLAATCLTQAEASGEVLHNGGMQCLYCQSTHICKNGNRKGKQNYLCKKCDRQFINSYSSKRYPSEVRERCLKLYADGMGYRAIARETGVSHNTVINWIKQDNG
ncbi:MAG: sigma-70 family RNA polymerase sigma factor [Tolypothrix brevis GSE-NOS-MK-07-07A]|jgi:RNA polymerase sigma-70 factor (ECF subfamily)|nr:sigma-70 family RNA polymerase sigma factor [Tolypothrix brevis GSE-NOS-MK-07-07A]